VKRRAILGFGANSSAELRLLLPLLFRLSALSRLIPRFFLARMELRPAFVGLERQFVMSVITEEASSLRKVSSRERRLSRFTRTDGAGWWIVQVGEGRIIE
jgi:hypothetical protein